MDSLGFVYITVVANFAAARSKAKNMAHVHLVKALMKSLRLTVEVHRNAKGHITSETAALAKVRVRYDWAKWVTMPESQSIGNHLSFFSADGTGTAAAGTSTDGRPILRAITL